MAADCRRKAPNRPDTTLSGAEGGAKGSTPRNIHRCSSKRFTPARPSRRSELLPSRFAWVHAHPTVEIPRLRFATLGMTEQCTIHNYSARSCCHLERSRRRSRKVSSQQNIHPCEASPLFAANEGRNVRVQSFARDGCGLPAQSAESAGYHLERSRRRSERLDTAEHSSVQFKTVHTGTTVEAFGTFTLAICMGSCSSDRRDPSISLRYTRDDRTMHDSQLFCTLLLSCRAEGSKARSRDIRHRNSHGLSQIRPSGPLDCARGDRAMHNGSRCSNLRDSSTAPPASLGMT